MGRIRTIKPEFPVSESMGNLSRDARLTFILLWTICDDEGRARAHSRMLANALFPYDPDAVNLIDGWLAELQAENCIVLYEHDGKHFLQVLNWSKHQRVDKPYPSKIPPFQEQVTNIPRTFANDLGRNVSRKGIGKDQEPRARDDEKSEQSTAAGLACRAIMAHGIQANPSHPDLLAAIAEGTTTQEFSDAAAECKAKGKGFPYLLAMVRRRKAEAAAPVKQTEPRKREPFRAGEKKPRGDPSRLGEHLAEIGKRFGVGDDEGGTASASLGT